MKIFPALIYSAGVLALCALGASSGTASTEKVLHSLPGYSGPRGPLLQDSNGTLYGTLQALDNSGAVYSLTQQNGIWKFQVLHGFGGGQDGKYPYAAVVEDQDQGTLYGTTGWGGTSNMGVVFSLTPAVGNWREDILHNFSGADGEIPSGPLLKDKVTGALYGTTEYGGPSNCGTVFQLSPSGEGWTFQTLYFFRGQTEGDCHPVLQLRPGPEAGTLIGMTNDGNGAVFELRQKGGVWNESLIYVFSGGSDGRFPNDLDRDASGTIYGCTDIGGSNNAGVIFQLSPHRKRWSYKVIYSFSAGLDGAYPMGINFDANTGSLYGATYSGGAYNSGTVFQLRKASGSWAETVVYSFMGGHDGKNPTSRPIIDHATGALYGTTDFGGKRKNQGTIYEVQP